MVQIVEVASTASGLHGLTTAEANRRLAVDGPNELPRPRTPGVVLQAVHHLLEPLSLVLLAAAVASVVVLDHVAEGGAIGAIVALNVTIATAQERRSASAIEALEELAAPTARVRRDGRLEVVRAASLVRGDIVELQAGDRVPADLALREAVSLAIDEATLTGESFPADKQVGVGAAGGADEASAGTAVVRGRGVGIVVRTGRATAMGAIASGLGAPSDPPLVRELRGVATRVSILAIILGAALIPLVLARAGDDDDRVITAVLAGVALAVAAIPEGLATIVVTALALGARRMASRGAIVRRLAAIEALGSAGVICTDKTGTLTTGRLAVSASMPVPGRDADLWRAALLCNDARNGIGDPVDVALVDAALEHGARQTLRARVRERPFDAETRSMATVHHIDGAPVLTVKGAPEVVLGRCPQGPDTARLLEQASTLAASGMRVLALATAAADDLDATGLQPLGLIAFHDPLRPSAAEAVARCRDAGIRLVLVTGDHIATARSVAALVGIEGPATSGDALRTIDPFRRAEVLREAAIVARVDPSTKLDLVEAHRAGGHVVAMTGDGVNDAPALRRADIGVAIAGEGGTDVAREAADLVVTDGDLGTIVAAVSEGRRIRRNLRSVVGYLITGNMSEVLVVAAALVLLPDLAVPLLPVQLLWVNLVTDGLPALALGVDQPSRDPLLLPAGGGESLLTAARLRVLAMRGAIVAGAVVLTGVIARQWEWDAPEIRTQLLLTLLIAHVMVAYAARAERYSFEVGWWRNRTLAVAVTCSLLLQLPAFCTSPGRAALGLAALPTVGWVLAGVASAVSLAGIDLLRARRTR